MFDPPDTRGYETAHVQYYSHGAGTLLRETAHPYSLYLSDECDNIPLASIYQKVNVRVLPPGEDEPLVTEEDNIYLSGYRVTFASRHHDLLITHL